MRRWHLLVIVALCSSAVLLLWPVAVQATTSVAASPHQADQAELATAISGWLAIVATVWVGSASAVIWAVAFFSETSARAMALLISPRPLQRWMHSLVGLSLTAGLAAPAPGAGPIDLPDSPRTTVDAEEGAGTAVMRPIGPTEDAAATESTSTTVLSPSSSSSTSQGPPESEEAPTPSPTPEPIAPSTTEADLAPSTTLPPSSPSSTTTPVPGHRPPRTPDGGEPSPAAPSDPAPAPSPLGEREVVVEPGDSFWSIAVDEVGPSSAEREVASYWMRLIEANRGRLVVADQPDLIYPGQVMVLPD